MANVTIDIDQLTASLKAATRSSLPWTVLQATSYTLNEPTPPPITAYTLPSIMASASFVPASEYLWTYKDTRQVIIEYVVQRSTSWRTGRIRIFHDINLDYLASLNETKPQPLPSPFTAHTLYVSNTLDLDIGDCGVTIFAAHDTRLESEERFGITFQITNASPIVFPKIAATYVSVIPAR